jgi:histone H3/H4
MSDIIVKAKIKEYAKYNDKPLNVSGDFADALSEKVRHLLEDACRRAKENGRNTVMKKDL